MIAFRTIAALSGEYDGPYTPPAEDGVQVQKQLGTTTAPRGYLQFRPGDYSSNSNLYPCIVFLHGHEERGNGISQLGLVATQGLPKQLANGWNGEYAGTKYIVISPQQFTTFNGWTGNPNDPIANDGVEFVTWLLEESGLRIDPDRVY